MGYRVRVLWICPVRKRCGIAIYSNEYIKALKMFCTVIVIDCNEIAGNLSKFRKEIEQCDCVHLQYEQSLYVLNGVDYFKKICKQINKPLIVSLHELYEKQPGVFPREDLTGNWPTRKVKEIIYDYRHPIQTSFRGHCKREFYAEKIVVHHEFQRNILIDKKIESSRIKVISHPVITFSDIRYSIAPATDRVLLLGSTGFINPQFDYKLLFDTLDKLTLDWRFKWIGGLRREEDCTLLNYIESQINDRGWRDKFIITGWVELEAQKQLLKEIDIYLALFSDRSSSDSITRAFGARRFTIGTDVPPLKEIAQNYGALYISNDSSDIVKFINEIIANVNLQNAYQEAIDKYLIQNAFPMKAHELSLVYKEVIGL